MIGLISFHELEDFGGIESVSCANQAAAFANIYAYLVPDNKTWIVSGYSIRLAGSSILQQGHTMAESDQQFVRELVERNRYLTLATTDGVNPWIATLEYISDDDLNLYFFTPERTK